MRNFLSLGALIAFLVLPGMALGHDAKTAVAEMVQASKALLQTMTDEQKAKALFEFKSEERYNWHFIPRARKGLVLKEMTHEQRPLVHALLASGLSQKGLMKSATIMSLEQVLHEMEKGKGQFSRDPELYFVSFFGEPGAPNWGWRFEGHHLAINFTIAGDQLVSATPTFYGSNPAEIREGKRKGLRVLAAEEDLGRALFKSLNESQKKKALISPTAFPDIITMAQRKAQPLEAKGIAAADLSKEQRRQLQVLIEEYVGRERAELAKVDLEKIEKAGFNKIIFAWAGGAEKGEPHYYRVQGPTFLLEYDSTQNQANHIHAVWRDFENDFGEDILKRHYEEHHQKR